MVATGFSLFIAFAHLVMVNPILFDLLNGFGPRYPQCICTPPPCAAAATASATSISGATIAEQAPISRPPYTDEVQPFRPSPYSRGYAPQPPSPPPPPPYPSRYPYRKRIRRKTLAKSENGNQATECTNETIGEIIQQSMTSSLEESQDRIRRSLLTHYGREVIVLCSQNQLHIAVTDGIELCKKSRAGMSCYAFVF